MAKLPVKITLEEGEDHVKPLWPLQIGLEMHYKGDYRKEA